MIVARQTRSLFRRALARSSSTTQGWSVCDGLPKLSGLSSKSTLGEVWDRVYVNYRYRLLYPLGAWAGLMWYIFWVPYKPKAQKQAEKERMDYLKSLEFSQSP